MNDNLRGKTSSRSGRFKKKLVSPTDLEQEAPLIQAKMAPVLDSFKKNQLKDSEFTAIYLIAVLSQRFPKTWLGAKRPSLAIQDNLSFPLCRLNELDFVFEENIHDRLSEVSTLGELFNNFALKSTPETVNRTILSWSNGSYPLELMFRIPSSLEVLDQQICGRRCVTVMTTAEKTKSYILGERDALSFTMHDLIHADHFFHHSHSYEGQLGFYGLMHFCLKENLFRGHLGLKSFSDELDYLISDMNAYAIHLLKCLKAAIYFYIPGPEVFFLDWLQKVSANHSEQVAFSQLNSSDYVAEVSDAILLEFLSKWKNRSLRRDTFL